MATPSPSSYSELPERLDEVLPPDQSLREEYARLLSHLWENGGRCHVSKLTRRLVDHEADANASDLTESYRSTYLGLHREYLPTLVTVGLVKYDGTDGTVVLTAGIGPGTK